MWKHRDFLVKALISSYFKYVIFWWGVSGIKIYF